MTTQTFRRFQVIHELEAACRHRAALDVPAPRSGSALSSSLVSALPSAPAIPSSSSSGRRVIFNGDTLWTSATDAGTAWRQPATPLVLNGRLHRLSPHAELRGDAAPDGSGDTVASLLRDAARYGLDDPLALDILRPIALGGRATINGAQLDEDTTQYRGAVLTAYGRTIAALQRGLLTDAIWALLQTVLEGADAVIASFERMAEVFTLHGADHVRLEK